MPWLLSACGVIAVVILGMLILGLLQPVKHSVTRVIHLKQTPETVFATIESVEDLPHWSSAVLKMERLPENDGKPAARMTLKWGHTVMLVTQLECKPPVRLVTRMEKENGPVLGTWTYELSAQPDGCRVSLTEDGELTNPFYRAIGRLRGLDANVRGTLNDLARKFGESADAPPGG